MAIDTAERRRAVASFRNRTRAPGVTPDVSMDAEWRQEALGSYPGIAAAAASSGRAGIAPEDVASWRSVADEATWRSTRSDSR